MQTGENVTDDRATVYYDGSCGVCSGIASFIRKRDRRNQFRLVPVQSDEGVARLRPLGYDTDNPNTMVLSVGERFWFRSDSSLRIARRLGFPWSLAWVFILVPRPIRDWAYTRIARNRHRLPGGRSTCPLPLADNTGAPAQREAEA